MILPIITFPNEFLRNPTKPVTFPLDKSIQKLTQDMIDTVRNAEGIGLAAPQVGKSVKLVIINLEKSGIPLFALYNPRIIKTAGKKIDLEEGCLSIPGIFGMVRRPQKIVLQAENSQGQTIELQDDGWIARVAQHEINHINGILILDLIKKYTQGEDQVKLWRKEKLLG